jgi:hypothetical protein
MEANRPAPVNLDSYAVGAKRIEVIGRLGSPTSTQADGDRYCDVYRLYTKSLNRTQKGVIIVGEATADILTGGLFEVVAAPAEAATRAKQHTVLFCYSNDNVLVSVTDEGRPVRQVASRTPPEGPREDAKAASQ